MTLFLKWLVSSYPIMSILRFLFGLKHYDNEWGLIRIMLLTTGFPGIGVMLFPRQKDNGRWKFNNGCPPPPPVAEVSSKTHI